MTCVDLLYIIYTYKKWDRQPLINWGAGVKKSPISKPCRKLSKQCKITCFCTVWKQGWYSLSQSECRITMQNQQCESRSGSMIYCVDGCWPLHKVLKSTFICIRQWLENVKMLLDCLAENFPLYEMEAVYTKHLNHYDIITILFTILLQSGQPKWGNIWGYFQYAMATILDDH